MAAPSDPSTVPLSLLRAPQRTGGGGADDSASDISSSGPAPTHYPRQHDPHNPHFYEGFEPGNQPNPDDSREETSQPHVRIGGAHIPRGAYQVAHGHDDDGDTSADLSKPQPPFSAHPQDGRHSRASSLGGSSADETDDFDWDTSDDEEENEAHVNAKLRAKRGRKVYLFCMRLARPVRIFLVGLFITVLFLVPLFVSLFGIDRSNPARPHVESWSIWLSIIAASSAGTFIVLDFLPPVILRLAIAVYGRAPEVFKTYLEVAMGCLVYVKLVLCVAWAWIALGGVNAAVWSGGVGPRPTYWKWVERAVKAIFATAIILAVEKFALHGIGVNFHKESIKDRLEENQKALRYLDKLHASKYMRETSGSNTKRQSGNWARMGFGSSKPPSPGANAGLGARGYFPESNAAAAVPPAADQHGHHHGHHHHVFGHHHSETASSEALRKAKTDRKANFAAQLQDALATATMKDSKLYKKSSGSQASARRLAKKLFQNLGRHRKTLVAEDFIPYFKSETEAREAFALFDKDKNGDIDKSEMRDAVQRIYRDRRALTTSLKDMNSALQKLDGVLMFVGLIIVVFIWLLIFSPTSTVSNLVPLSTIVLGFSFVFGNSAKNIFESMIFIFATHPYDVGDLVCIDDNWMFVKEFGLISTVFTTVVNQTVVAPNALLASQKYIHNARRSGSQWEVTYVQLPFDTALAKIDDFRRLLRAWIKENDREWGGGLEVNYDSISNQTAVQLVIAMEHKGNWQDWGTRWSRRTKLMRQVKVVAEELGIDATPLPRQPVSYIHPNRGGVGPRSAGPRVGGDGPAGATAAQPGLGGPGGSAGGFGAGGMAIGGMGAGFGPNIVDKGKGTS